MRSERWFGWLALAAFGLAALPALSRDRSIMARMCSSGMPVRIPIDDQRGKDCAAVCHALGQRRKSLGGVDAQGG